MQTNIQPKPRAAAPKSQGTGWKVLIMVASLAGMVGGWGILAVDQSQNVAAAQTQVSQSNSPASNTSSIQQSSGFQQQVTGRQAFPQVVTRSRSSR